MSSFWQEVLRRWNQAPMPRILLGWILFLSFYLPYARLTDFIPELWRPIFPFQFLTLNGPILELGLWVWRISLLLALFLPSRVIPLILASFFSFLGLGLRNCFGLQVQLFASLELAMFCLVFLSLNRPNQRDFECLFGFGAKLLLVLLFFSAGLAKIRWSGFDWSISGTVQPYLEFLLPLNRDVFGFTWVLGLREFFLQHPGLVRASTLAAHLLELLCPLALFFSRCSRFFLYSLAAFVVMNLLFMGANFYTLLPLFILWWGWDFCLSDVVRLPAFSRRIPSLGFSFLVSAQLFVTLAGNQNYWPVMANDMYAKPMIFPLAKDLRIEAISKDGTTQELNRNASFSPFTKFHLFISLFRLKDQPSRDALLNKFYRNYLEHTCPEEGSTRHLECRNFIGLQAIRVLRAGDAPEIIAQTARH